MLVFVLLINCLLSINEAVATLPAIIEECPSGQYPNIDGDCVLCPEGTSSTGGGDDINSCLPCGPGTYSNPTRSECILCDSGGYCRSTSEPDGGYIPCPLFRYNKDKGKHLLVDCEPCKDKGKYPNVERTECEEQCQLGTKLEVTDSVYKCSACTLGTYSNAERTSCILCSEVRIVGLF